MYKVNKESKTLTRLVSTDFVSENMKERYDIQEWIENDPSILQEELLLIGKEVELPSGIRIDLLALDKVGNTVVVELKRDDSGRYVDLQAIKYASYVSLFDLNRIIDQYSTYTGCSDDDALNHIVEFINIDEEDLNQINAEQRIILVSREFHSDVASSVLWLIGKSTDIKCIKISPYRDENGDLFLTSNIIIPPPEASDYIIKTAKKRNQESASLGRSTYSNDVSSLPIEDLKDKLIKTLKELESKKSNLLPRLLSFLNLLWESQSSVARDEVKNHLFATKLSNDLGLAGTHLSNISQFITRKQNSHVRQVVGYDSEDGAGKEKENYHIKPAYKDLVKEVLLEFENPH